MKKIWKIMLAAVCVVMLSMLVVVAVSANANDAKLESVQVVTGGSVKMNFNYSTLGDAVKMVVEVGDETTEIPVADVSTNGQGRYVVTVPLSPDQMATGVKVYAVDAEGNKSAEKVYSVREYALAVMNNPNHKAYHASMRGLLNWGAMADVHFNEGANANNINKGIYAAGTNPVNGLVSFFNEETGAVSNGTNVRVSGYQAFLEPGNTSMKLYFTYAGSEKLTATVEREGSSQVVTLAPVKESENTYSVQISNIGVAVFDKAYTVTVKAGSDSASITKTMLEYLDTIAFGDDYSSAQQNLAKAMYQFYVQAMNVEVEGCQHATETHKILVGGAYCTTVYCSNCFDMIENLAHEMENGKCAVCGLTEYTEDEDWSGPSIDGDLSTPDVPVTPDVESLSKFDLDAYMLPIWDTNIVHNETVMFLWNENEAPLLYSADKIIAVRSYALDIVYEEGVDYKLENGKLIRLEGSRMPCADESMFYTESGSSMKGYVEVDGQVVPLYAGDNVLKKWQVAVTYTHSDEWAGPEVKSYASTRYAGLVEKLEKGEDVSIFFYGDSITVGANASGLAGRPPYTPTWSRMFCQYLAKQYGYTVEYISLDYNKGTTTSDVYGTNGTIRYINTAMGGETSAGGISNFSSRNDAFIAQYGCDLAVIAYGMNDIGATASQHASNMESLANKFIAKAPNTDILLIATMEPNPDLVPAPGASSCANSTQRTFEPALIELAEKINGNGTNCAVAPMTSISLYINQEAKRFRDSSGNHLNHPNDFLVRVYAQTVYQTVIGYED